MTITEWIAGTALPVDVDGPPRQLEPLRRIVGDAVVVGIGGSTYGAHEQFTLAATIIRYLVEELGFRAVATEDDWDVALDLDRYVLTGEGDLAALVRGSGVPWQTAEVRDTVAWIRDYNVAHPLDPVRFVGVGVIDTRPAVYDLVADYVRSAAPDRLERLEALFAPIRPTRPDHLRWFFTEATDHESFVTNAWAALELVEGVPHADGDRAWALAVQHTRQIVGVYEHYTHHVVEDGYRDLAMAENLRWWHGYTGARIAYWSTNAHSVDGKEVTISIPPKGQITFAPTGGHLREFFGTGYVSIGLTFDHGTVNSAWGLPPFQRQPVPMPPVPTDFAEYPLRTVPRPSYLLELGTDAPDEVGQWLAAPARTRVIGSICDPGRPPEEYWMTGGSLVEWYDALVHVQQVGPTKGL